MEFINYLIDNHSEIISLFIEHIELTFLSVGLAILIGIPLGILISYIKPLGKPVLGLTNVIQAIPSMALLGFVIPFLGIGSKPAIVMVILYSLLPIVKNTYTGIKNISPQIVEAAKGIGLTNWQVLTKVQIPQALPMIMAGIRISSVSAVGLMTLAAFVGAGGLGYLVYAGIRSVNNIQILAGAIPACLLALMIDYLASLVENLVTPASMRQNTKKSFFKQPLFQKIILLLATVLIIFMILFNHLGTTTSDKEITIGSMDFTEQEILSYMVKYLVEDNSDITVNQRLSLGSSSIVLGALKTGDIDLYIDYTGTIYGNILKHEPNSNIQEVYDISKQELKEQYQLNLLNDLNFNNTYTLTVTKETAEKYNLKTISDLSVVAPNLVFSPTLTCMERQDCWLGLEKRYNLSFRDIVPIDGSPRYVALTNQESDVVDAYSTDGLIQKYDLVVLEDDQNFFLPYQAVPVTNNRLIQEFPEVEPLLEKLSHYLNDEVIRNLNYQVDENKKTPSEVAKNFLLENDLIEEG